MSNLNLVLDADAATEMPVGSILDVELSVRPMAARPKRTETGPS